MHVAESVGTAFNLDHASGRQLDVIGEWVGISRLLNFEPTYAPPLLTDEYHRMVIRAKISLNSWDGTTEHIKEIWESIVKDYSLTVIDMQGMSIVLQINDLESLFETEFMSKGYLAPKPEGVRIDYVFVLTRKFESELFLASFPPDMQKTIYLPDMEPVFRLSPEELHIASAYTLRKTTIYFD